MSDAQPTPLCVSSASDVDNALDVIQPLLDLHRCVVWKEITAVKAHGACRVAVASVSWLPVKAYRVSLRTRCTLKQLHAVLTDVNRIPQYEDTLHHYTQIDAQEETQARDVVMRGAGAASREGSAHGQQEEPAQMRTKQKCVGGKDSDYGTRGNAPVRSPQTLLYLAHKQVSRLVAPRDFCVESKHVVLGAVAAQRLGLSVCMPRGRGANWPLFFVQNSRSRASAMCPTRYGGASYVRGWVHSYGYIAYTLPPTLCRTAMSSGTIRQEKDHSTREVHNSHGDGDCNDHHSSSEGQSDGCDVMLQCYACMEPGGFIPAAVQSWSIGVLCHKLARIATLAHTALPNACRDGSDAETGRADTTAHDVVQGVVHDKTHLIDPRPVPGQESHGVRMQSHDWSVPATSVDATYQTADASGPTARPCASSGGAIDVIPAASAEKDGTRLHAMTARMDAESRAANPASPTCQMLSEREKQQHIDEAVYTDGTRDDASALRQAVDGTGMCRNSSIIVVEGGVTKDSTSHDQDGKSEDERTCLCLTELVAQSHIQRSEHDRDVLHSLSILARQAGWRVVTHAHPTPCVVEQCVPVAVGEPKSPAVRAARVTVFAACTLYQFRALVTDPTLAQQFDTGLVHRCVSPATCSTSHSSTQTPASLPSSVTCSTGRSSSSKTCAVQQTHSPCECVCDHCSRGAKEGEDARFSDLSGVVELRHYRYSSGSKSLRVWGAVLQMPIRAATGCCGHLGISLGSAESGAMGFCTRGMHTACFVWGGTDAGAHCSRDGKECGNQRHRRATREEKSIVDAPLAQIRAWGIVAVAVPPDAPMIQLMHYVMYDFAALKHAGCTQGRLSWLRRGDARDGSLPREERLFQEQLQHMVQRMTALQQLCAEHGR